MQNVIFAADMQDAIVPAEMQAVFALPEEDAVVEKYAIGVGDVLTVSVWHNPDLSVTVPVRPDGFISMPLLGDVRAGGFNAEDLAGDISMLLESRLPDPQVTVMVSEINSDAYVSRVRIAGAVRNPATLPYARGMSVLDVVLEADGVSDTAAANRTRLYRTVAGELYETEVRLEDILLRGNLDTNYMLRPGDVIIVPERLVQLFNQFQRR